METNNQNQKKEAFNRIYEVLKFTSDEAKTAIADLAAIQQVAIATELMKVLTEDEIKIITDLAQKSVEEKKTAMEQIAANHKNDAGFTVKAREAAKKVLGEHIEYLKTRGDEAQRAEIAKILAGIA